MADFLTFRRMITPVVIQVLFWIGVVVVVIVGLFTLTQPNGVLPGLATIILGPILVRVYAEILLVIFMIHSTLEDIRENTSRAAPAPQGGSALVG